jgi:hypothetical protein
MSENLQRDPASRPGEPTSAAPGSAVKIRVLMERASRREALFHPGDNLQRAFPNQEAEPELEMELELELQSAPGEAYEAELAGCQQGRTIEEREDAVAELAG